MSAPQNPLSTTDYQPSVIAPVIPSSASSFPVSPLPNDNQPFPAVTGYPAAGAPSPIPGDQPSREYLPARRT